VEAEIQTMVPGMTHRFVPPIFEEPEYLEAVSATASPMLAHGFDHVLFSFQGVPERQLRTSDPTGSHCMGSEHCCELFSPARRTCYRAQCLATARGVAERLEIPEGQWSVSFQSGLGREPWTRPNTETTLKSLGGRGVERLFVLCPSFVADCPETLEEIGIRGKETYHSAGGGELTLVPCLNDHPAWIEAICSILVRQIDPAECAYPN
jgi:ferrochelatase